MVRFLEIVWSALPAVSVQWGKCQRMIPLARRFEESLVSGRAPDEANCFEIGTG
jgi:hypothetical protein